MSLQITPCYSANLVNKKPCETGIRDNGTEELMGIILFVSQYSQVGKKTKISLIFVHLPSLRIIHNTNW